MSVSGSCHTGQGIQADQIRLTGVLQTGGDIHTANFEFKGAFTIRGRLCSDNVHMEINSDCRVEEGIAADYALDAGVNAARLDALLRDFALEGLAPGPLQRLRAQIDASCAGHSLDATVAAIAETACDDPWWQRAQAALERGCPSSIRLSWEIQRRASRLSLAEIFRLELIAALACAAHGDFFEGIRALLIDKDKAPRWNPATLADTAGDFIETFFTAPWPVGGHPLADLGEDDPQREALR